MRRPNTPTITHKSSEKHLLEIKKFQKTVWDFYKKNRREMDWRNTKDPYKILVSEIMLQQTQVSRVKEKYKEFLSIFPTTKALANASLTEVFKIWKGLGYNRRAQFIKRAAEAIEKDYGGKFPHEYAELLKLPGIGQSTAGALTAFAFNKPIVFIETNIRTVFIHHFFNDSSAVLDSQLVPLIEQSVDVKNPREWYYALYDYGTWIKQTYGNKSRQSKSYAKQSSFKGSFRELRSVILHFIVSTKSSSYSQLLAHIIKTLPNKSEGEIKQALDALIKDNAIIQEGNKYKVA